MDDAIKLLPADYWRYALLAKAPQADDTNFTWEPCSRTVNKDLAGIVANFVTRTLKLAQSRFGAVIPEGGEPGDAEADLYRGVDAAIRSVTDEMDTLRFRPAAFALRTLW